MITYSMTPVNNGTRRRKDHNTFSAYVLPSVDSGVLVEGDELWIAPADGNEVRKDDRWLKITKVGGVAVTETLWMAQIHKGLIICDNFKEVITDPAPNPTPTPTFPQSFILTDPSGVRAEYEFVRIIEE